MYWTIIQKQPKNVVRTDEVYFKYVIAKKRQHVPMQDL